MYIHTFIHNTYMYTPYHVLKLSYTPYFNIVSHIHEAYTEYGVRSTIFKIWYSKLLWKIPCQPPGLEILINNLTWRGWGLLFSPLSHFWSPLFISPLFLDIRTIGTLGGQFPNKITMNRPPQGGQQRLGATWYPGGQDDFYMPEVISPSPQRYGFGYTSICDYCDCCKWRKYEY